MKTIDHACILLFVKYPEKRHVKQRLSVDLDETIVVNLYRNFVLDIISTLEKLNIYFYICFYPNNAQKKFIAWLGDQYCFMPQQGINLGERMKNSFMQAFADGFQRAVLIGSDSPDLPAELLTNALWSLATNDVVLGPSSDGGYYLIGFTHATFIPEMFNNIHWSTTKVFQETETKLKNLGKKAYILPEWHDVDTLADLRAFIKRNSSTAFRSSRTMSYVRSLKL